MPHPTGLTAEVLSHAYQVFNWELFGGLLPEVMLTLSCVQRVSGYLREHGFAHHHTGKPVHEVALNPLMHTTLQGALLELCHLCVHVWQVKNGMHKKEWAEYAVGIGLRPESTRNPEKMTGQKITHSLIPGSPLAAVLDLLRNERFRLTYVPYQPSQELDEGHTEPAEKKKKVRTSKHRHTCPNCGAHAWASKSAEGSFKCVPCDRVLELQRDEEDFPDAAAD